MELSEAKEILKERVKIDRSLRDSVESDFDEFCENECIAIDTVLKALDNSIDKKQHDMIVKSMNGIIDSLQEKLDNSISKDEVKEKMDNEGKLFIETRDVRYANRRKILKELLGDD